MVRKKVEMKLVENSNSRQVMFSKRRNGVFKKASELVTLCGVEVAILTFSPGNKPFSYGHPSIDIMFDRFLKNDSDVSEDGLASKCTKNIEKLNQELADLQNELEIETRKGKLLERELEKKVKLTRVVKSSAEEHGKVLQDLGMSEKEMEACSALLLLSKA